MMDCFSEGAGRLLVKLQWKTVGNDWIIIISGGERPHIGATAIAWTTADGMHMKSLTLPGHKEDQIAQACAARCCKRLKATVQVSCGIHIDHAKKEEIEALVEQSALLTERFLCTVSQDSVDKN